MIDIDTTQWRAMHSLCIQNLIRSSGVMRMDRRSEPISRRGETWQTIGSFIGYGVMSLFIAGAVSSATYPVGEFLVISFLTLLVYTVVSAQCSNVLFTRKELHVFGALPISAQTHLASKISGTIAYQLLVCLALTAPAFFVISLGNGLFAGIRWVVIVAFCVLFLCFVAISIHSVFFRIFREANPAFGLTKTIFWTGISSAVLAIWIVLLLAEFELSELGESWNLIENPLLLLFPPYWFICLLLFLEGQFNPTSIAGALLAIFSSVPMCLYSCMRSDAAHLATLRDPTYRVDATSRSPNSSARFKWLRIGSLGYERAAMWKLAFSHLKYDTPFQTNWFAFFPLLFVSVSLILKANVEPWVGPLTATDHAWLLTWSGCLIFFYEFVLFEALRTSRYAPACWVLFVSPSNVTRYTALSLDWLFVVFVLPVLILLGIVFSYVLPSLTDAALLTITLGWLSYAAINLKSIVIPALPFAQHTSGSRSSQRFCLNFLLVVTCGVVVFYALASWMYISQLTYSASIVIGLIICVAVRYLAGVRYDRKFLNADLVS